MSQASELAITNGRPANRAILRGVCIVKAKSLHKRVTDALRKNDLDDYHAPHHKPFDAERSARRPLGIRSEVMVDLANQPLSSKKRKM